MKKSLIALAALAAVGAASAQSSVTLYGLVDIGYGSHTTTSRDGSNTIRSRGVIEGSNASNRIGFMGTEDLGGGLKANFLIEQGISPTNPQLFATRVVGLGHQLEGQNPTLAGKGAFSNSTNRQSYLGLTSSTIGSFNIGRQYSIADQLASLSGYNIGAENSVGATAHLAGMLGPVIVGTRANAIQYISPNFGGGFVARAQYGSGDGREVVESTNALSNGLTTAKTRMAALMLQYANGPLSGAAAYTNVRSQAINGFAGNPAGATTNAFGVITPAPTSAALTGQERTANLFQLGGSYDFGVAKLGATYNTGKTGGSATSTTSSRLRSYQIGVSAPFGAIVPFVSFGRVYTTPDGAARTEDSKMYQLGVRYSLSKRTTAYAIYGESRDDAAPAAGAAFYKDRKGSVGVSHSF